MLRTRKRKRRRMMKTRMKTTMTMRDHTMMRTKTTTLIQRTRAKTRMNPWTIIIMVLARILEQEQPKVASPTLATIPVLHTTDNLV
jgi:hypothetical protein